MKKFEELFQQLCSETELLSNFGMIAYNPKYKELLAYKRELLLFLYYQLRSDHGGWPALMLAKDILSITMYPVYAGKYLVQRDIMIAILHEELGLNRFEEK